MLQQCENYAEFERKISSVVLKLYVRLMSSEIFKEYSFEPGWKGCEKDKMQIKSHISINSNKFNIIIRPKI